MVEQKHFSHRVFPRIPIFKSVAMTANLENYTREWILMAKKGGLGAPRPEMDL